jgi:hypothetical protein
MICGNCKAPNNNDNVFCTECGVTLAPVSGQLAGGTPAAPVRPGVFAHSQPPNYTPSNSTETEVVRTPSSANFSPAMFQTGERTQARRGNTVVYLAAGFLAVLIAAAGVYYFTTAAPPVAAEVLPGHLGLFVQSAARDRADEIKKFDFADASKAKEELIKNESLPVADTNPSLILYSDGKDVPVGDLKLLPLDSLNTDGTFKQINFQAAPVDGKPEMKRIRVPDGLANGKYAFALLDGFFNEGKHKFWPFVVANAAKSDNGNALTSSSLQVKPPPPKPVGPTRPVAPPPAGGTLATSTTHNLVLRSGPSQSSAKIRNLDRGEQVYVIEYSTNTEMFKGTASRYALVQTMRGERGWAFAAFLR